MGLRGHNSFGGPRVCWCQLSQVKTATYGAFVCFEPASEGGGEFFIADGAKIVNDLDKDVLERIYKNKATRSETLKPPNSRAP